MLKKLSSMKANAFPELMRGSVYVRNDFIGSAPLVRIDRTIKSTPKPAVQAAPYSASKPDCSELAICTEVANPQEAFGNYYVGHDEPSVEFYSNVPGSGNHNQYQLTIPTEPAGPPIFPTADGAKAGALGSESRGPFS